jgi:hypothetical protein
MQLKKRERYKQLVVIKLAPVGPTNRPKSPATILPARGNIGMQRYIFMQQPPFRRGYQVEDIKRYACLGTP